MQFNLHIATECVSYSCVCQYLQLFVHHLSHFPCHRLQLPPNGCDKSLL